MPWILRNLKSVPESFDLSSHFSAPVVIKSSRRKAGRPVLAAQLPVNSGCWAEAETGRDKIIKVLPVGMAALKGSFLCTQTEETAEDVLVWFCGASKSFKYSSPRELTWTSAENKTSLWDSVSFCWLPMTFHSVHSFSLMQVMVAQLLGERADTSYHFIIEHSCSAF